MAGTRLWVQSIFVVEFFAILWIAVYIGLLHNNPDDPLSIVLFPPPGRSFLSNHALQYDHHQRQHHHHHHHHIDDDAHNNYESFFPRVNQLPLPAATAASARTGSNDVAFWETVLQKIKSPQDYILINPKINTNNDDESTVLLLCRDPSILLQQQQQQKNHLYICDDFQHYDDSMKQHHRQQQQMNHSRVVVRNGTMLFYPPHSLSSSSLSPRTSFLDDSSSEQQRIAAAAALNEIYPTTACSCHDIPIHFKLLVDMTAAITPQEETMMHDDYFDSSNNHVSPGDWKVWMDALNLALIKIQPGLKSSFPRPRLTLFVELVSTNLAAAATQQRETTTTTTTTSQSVLEQNDESSWKNQTTIVSSTSTTIRRHEITLNQLVQLTTDMHGHDDDDPFIAYFYISNLPGPLLVVANDHDDEAASQTVALSKRVIFRILDSVDSIIAQQLADENNHDHGSAEGQSTALRIQKEAALALDQVMDFMTRSCLGIDATTTTMATLWDTDGSLPHFYQALLFQRAVQELYEKAVTAVQTQRHLVLSTSNHVPIREHHIAVWQRAVDNIFHAIHVLQEMQQHETTHKSTMAMTMRRRRRMEVLDCLQQAIRLMEQMRTNPDFIDRLDFPLEQYAAILAPLALPLAIPLLVGLIREYKRYREKQQKKDSLASSSLSPSQNDTSIKQD